MIRDEHDKLPDGEDRAITPSGSLVVAAADSGVAAQSQGLAEPSDSLKDDGCVSAQFIARREICPESLDAGDIDSLPAETIEDTYDLLEVVASGGTATVYAAYHRILQRKVALKLFHVLPEGDDRSAVNKLKREFDAVSALEHPGIVKVFAAGLLQGRPYLMMEFFPGVTLAQFIAKEGPLSIEQFCSVFRAVASALMHAHSRNVIHRDLKPANIMLSMNANTVGLVKVVDFGLARFSSPEQHGTATGVICGTGAYMSPEQCVGGPVDRRSDIYSLGCVMYEAITGKPAFSGDSVYDLMYKHLHASLSGINTEGIPGSLTGILARCLQKNPEQRYQTVSQLYSDLERLSFGQPPTDQRRLRCLLPAAVALSVCFCMVSAQSRLATNTPVNVKSSSKPAGKTSISSSSAATKKSGNARPLLPQAVKDEMYRLISIGQSDEAISLGKWWLSKRGSSFPAADTAKVRVQLAMAYLSKLSGYKSVDKPLIECSLRLAQQAIETSEPGTLTNLSARDAKLRCQDALNRWNTEVYEGYRQLFNEAANLGQNDRAQLRRDALDWIVSCDIHHGRLREAECNLQTGLSLIERDFVAPAFFLNASRIALCRHWHRLGKSARVLALLERCRLDCEQMEETPARIGILQMYRELGFPQQAEQWARRCLLPQADPLIQLELVHALIALEKIPEACQVIEAIERDGKLDPPKVLFVKAHCRQKSGRRAEAKTLAKQIIAELLAPGRVLEQWDLRLLKFAVELQAADGPSSEEKEYLRSLLRSSRNCLNANGLNAVIWTTMANLSSQETDFASAAAELETAIDLYKHSHSPQSLHDCIDALGAVAKLHFRLRNIARFKSLMQEAVDLSVENGYTADAAGLLLDWTCLCLELSNPAEAKVLLQRMAPLVASLGDKRIECRMISITLLLDGSDRKRLDALYEEGLHCARLIRSQEDRKLGLGAIHFAYATSLVSTDSAANRRHLHEALNIWSTMKSPPVGELADCMGRLGRSYARAGEHDEALRWFQKSIRTVEGTPQVLDSADYLECSADEYRQLTKFEEAEASLKRALELATERSGFPERRITQLQKLAEIQLLQRRNRDARSTCGRFKISR